MIKGVLASIAIVLVLVLAVAITSSVASEETYRTEYGGRWIKLISSSELEYHTGDTTFLCKYSTQQGALRVIMAVLGTQQVLYFRRTSAGLVSEEGMTFFNPAALAEHRRQAALAQRAQEKARAEEQRLANLAAQREAEERRLAAAREQEATEKRLRVELQALETADCVEGSQTVPARSQRVFVLDPKRECWTPWLVVGGTGLNWKLGGNTLVQVVRRDGRILENEDGPTKVFTGISDYNPVEKVRFKSLHREPVKVTFIVY